MVNRPLLPRRRRPSLGQGRASGRQSGSVRPTQQRHGMDRRKGTPLPISDNLLLTGAQENLIWQRRGRTTRSLSSARPKRIGARKDGSDVNRTHFLYRIDMWTIDGEHVIEHLAGIEDFQLAMVTYRAACQRWPGAAITLRQGAKVIEDNRRERTA
jgi:hypothetical protein